jgi:hypothetical protein
MEKNEGWAAKEAAEQYIKIADIAIPYRKEILSLIATLATTFVPGPRLRPWGCYRCNIEAKACRFSLHGRFFR